MRLNLVIKLPTSVNYHMRQYEFEMTREDLPEGFCEGLTVAEIWSVLEFILNQRTKRMEVLNGNVQLDDAKKFLRILKESSLNQVLQTRMEKYGLLGGTETSTPNTDRPSSTGTEASST